MPWLLNTACYSHIFKLSVHCKRLLLPCGSARFLQFPGRSVICIPTHHLSDFLGVVQPFFKFFLTDNPLKSFDFFELLLQTQPTTSTYIENYHAASSWVKTFKISSVEVFLTGQLFFAKLWTYVAFIINI
jgi:hypothetical protein